MGKERERNRIRCKIDDLPEAIRDVVNAMIADTRNTYQDISDWLTEQEYDISRSAVGRYAMRTNSATQRIIEAQAQTKALVEVIKKNPDADYTEGALQIMAGELTKKMANAQEDWDNMALDKAARIMVQLSRTKAYKDKVYEEIRTKVKEAVKNIEETAKTKGIDPETLAMIKEQVYGIV